MNRKNVRYAFLISSFLLQYPDKVWKETLLELEPEIKKMRQEPYSEPLMRFLQFAEENDELDMAELYARTFDFTQENNLFLTYYCFKDQKERGAAMVMLKQKYAKAGFKMIEGELPDFLPVVLEFASASLETEILMEHKDTIQNIFHNLDRDNNPYSQVFRAVLLILEASESQNTSLDSDVSGGAVL